MPSQLTQDSLIQALVLLRRVHPDLPVIAWEISSSPILGTLIGKAAHLDDMPVLEAYAAALGGEIRHTHLFHNASMQQVTLTTSFADMRVEIYGAVPVVHMLAVAA